MQNLPLIIGAPMAGGISTPALARAVTEAGGLGFIAGGLLTAEALSTQLDRLGGVDFGVNLFVPRPGRPLDLESYRQALTPTARALGTEPGQPNWHDDDHYPAKLEVLLQLPPAVVSFTFGLPDEAVVQHFRRAGSEVWVTVTTPAEARASAARGADRLVVQGPGAGGHRGTHDPDATPDQTALPELLDRIAAEVSLPLIAAGGIGSRDDVQTMLAHGACAVQVGSLLLRTPESGAHAAHKAALAWPRDTVVTRCFSGRWARSVRNAFIDAHHELAPKQAQAPGAYPQVSHLTAPIRKAAQSRGDAEHMQLWAGTGHLAAREAPAADVVADLLTGASH